jgi:scyllo-inositol 2-dehydrogenase (NADP+)
MKRVAIIGSGLAARRFHGYLIGLVPGLEVLGYASRSEETRARIRAEGLRAWASAREAAGDPDVDLVVLATPHHLHAPEAIAALEAGKHVVTDKVMALTVEEADRMIEAARRAGRILTVFQNRRWDSDYLTLRKAVEDGLLGDLIAVESAVGRYKGPRGWRAERPSGGGLWYDWGAHLVDQVLGLLGADVESVTCDLRGGVWPVEVETFARATIRLRGGPLAILEASHIAREGKHRWLVHGTRATYAQHGLDPQEDAMMAGDIAAARRPPEHRPRLIREEGGRMAENVLPDVPGRWTAFYENVAAALEGREPVLVTAESARDALRVLEACRRSAERGETVRMRIP